jgi:hypothetical protein
VRVDKTVIERTLRMGVVQLFGIRLGATPSWYRVVSHLDWVGIATVLDLVLQTEADLAKIPNFGNDEVKRVRRKLREHGLRLGMKLNADGKLMMGDDP